jgi:acetamidase/formamidase
MLEEQDQDPEHRLAPHHYCGHLFGCGDEEGTGVLREEITAAASSKVVMDRLLHMDEVDQETLDSYLTMRGRSRRTFPWGAVFNNPGSLGTGLLAQDFPQGQVKYLPLDLQHMKAEFAPNISVPLKPFQGTLGVAPPDGYFPPLSPGVTSSVPPGPHAGNVDLRELSEGATLFIPVWKPGALLYTGDSHAVQGDGEISLTALEPRMQDMCIQVMLHKQKHFSWPVTETPTHWILLGLDKDLNVAMTLAARNAIDFLTTRAKLTPLDAYALCSIAVSFRVTQVVDIVRGVHAMVPKGLFTPGLQRQIAVV